MTSLGTMADPAGGVTRSRPSSRRGQTSFMTIEIRDAPLGGPWSDSNRCKGCWAPSGICRFHSTVSLARTGRVRAFRPSLFESGGALAEFATTGA